MTPQRFYSALIVPFMLAACSTAPTVDMTAERQAVTAASDSVVAQEMAKNLEGALSYYTDDAIVQMEGTPEVAGKDGLRRIYETFFGDTTILGFSSTSSNTEVAPGGGLAWEHGVNHFQVKGPNGPVEALGKYLAVWRKQADGWKIAALAITNDAPAESQ